MSKINWKVRLKNKTFIVTFVTTIIAFIYQMLGIFGVVPQIGQDSITNFLMIGINMLVALGVIADPTTIGISDSTQAMTYTKPKEEK